MNSNDNPSFTRRAFMAASAGATAALAAPLAEAAQAPSGAPPSAVSFEVNGKKVEAHDWATLKPFLTAS